jgi:hypothetical protein
MTTATETSLELLIGEMPAIPCEGELHGVETDVHDGPAVSYTRLNCPSCGLRPIKAHCALFIAWTRVDGNGVVCPDCWNVSHAPETVQILGPVRS